MCLKLELDSYGNQGLDYWMENVAPLMENVGGTRMAKK